MIVKILGIFDILIAILFWLFAFFHIIPQNLILVLAFCLLAKGILFAISLDFISIFDIIVAILIFVSLTITMPKIIVFLVAFFLLQKGIFSILA